MKRILIIEDNDKDFLNIYTLMENIENIDVYPKSVEQNRKLRKLIKAFYSAQDSKSVPAKAILDKMKINDYDGLILDYELYPSVRLVTGVQLYKDLKLDLKALILTKYTGRKFDIIHEIVTSEGFSDNLLVRQKGNLVVLSDEQKKEHLNNIEYHFFKQNVNNDNNTLKKRIIEKLNNNKPKLGAASDKTNKDIFRITEELVKKIDNSEFILKDEIENKLDFISDVKYLQILEELNS